MDLSENTKYLQWLQEKYNVQESLCDILIKDENDNPKWEKRMAKKVNSTPDDYAEYCKLMREEKNKTMTLSQIVIKIKEIIGNSQTFKIEFYKDEICFSIYESDVMIVYTAKNDSVLIDCEFVDFKLNADTVNELYMIMKMLDDNKELLKSLCE